MPHQPRSGQDQGRVVRTEIFDTPEVTRLLHFVASWAGATVADGVGT